MKIDITSPRRTTSHLLTVRPADNTSGPKSIIWTFKSLHLWDENPRGTWQLSAISTSKKETGKT